MKISIDGQVRRTMDIVLIVIAVCVVVFGTLGLYVSDVGAPTVRYPSDEAVERAFSAELTRINEILKPHGRTIDEEGQFIYDECCVEMERTLRLDEHTELLFRLHADNDHTPEQPLYTEPYYRVAVTRTTDSVPDTFSLCQEYPFVYEMVALLEGGRCKTEKLKAHGEKLRQTHEVNIREEKMGAGDLYVTDWEAYSGLLFKRGELSMETEQEESEAVYDEEAGEYVLETHGCVQTWSFSNYWYNVQ